MNPNVPDAQSRRYIEELRAKIQKLSDKNNDLWNQLETEKERPKVGVAVIVLNDANQVLLGLRKGSHGAQTWGLPGGHLEAGESVETCAARELMEETGLSLCFMPVRMTTNDIFTEEGKHYVTQYVMTQTDLEPRLLEPGKCEEWKWFDWDKLPENLFLCFRNLLEQFQKPSEQEMEILHGRGLIYKEIDKERASQDREWGGMCHDDEHWITDWLHFIRKQWVKATEVLESDPLFFDKVKSRFIKIAALSVAALESVQRKTQKVEEKDDSANQK